MVVSYLLASNVNTHHPWDGRPGGSGRNKVPLGCGCAKFSCSHPTLTDRLFAIDTLLFAMKLVLLAIITAPFCRASFATPDAYL
jgi:hypothetical protein